MIRIAIVDDESLVAQSLGTLLGLEEDLAVDVVCASGEELLDWWRRQQTTGGDLPDVCVCDLQLGGIDGIDTAMTISAGDSPLTDREAELLEIAGRGGSVEDIAAAAHLAPGTTRNYLSSAMGKVGAQNRFEAYTRARELGWV